MDAASPYVLCGCPPPYSAATGDASEVPGICPKCSEIPRRMLFTRIQKLEHELECVTGRLHEAHALNDAHADAASRAEERNVDLDLLARLYREASAIDERKRQVSENLALWLLNHLQEKGLLVEAQARWERDPTFPRTALAEATRRQLSRRASSV